MKLHPRYDLVQAARAEVGAAVWAAIKKHGLTYGEATSILAGELSECAKYQIREERHPGDPEARGDEA